MTGKITELMQLLSGASLSDLSEIDEEIKNLEGRLDALIELKKLLEAKLGKKTEKKKKPDPNIPKMDEDERAIGDLIRSLGPMDTFRIAKATGINKEDIKDLLEDNIFFVKEVDGWHITSEAMTQLLQENV